MRKPYTDQYRQYIEAFIKTRKGDRICELADDCLLLHYPDLPISALPDMPAIRRQNIDLVDLDYIGYQNTCEEASEQDKRKTVGFFLPDYRFAPVCLRPWNYVPKLSQYKQVMSPDLSCYTDMPIDEQWLNIYWNRFVGAFWQYCGLTVIPTLTWSDERGYDFCFSGITKGSVVAVSTLGTGSVRRDFLSSFKELCKQIEPEGVICYCTPYSEMHDYAKIYPLENEGHKKRRIIKQRPFPGQLSFVFNDEILAIIKT
jgi:hypothetical protein